MNVKATENPDLPEDLNRLEAAIGEFLSSLAAKEITTEIASDQLRRRLFEFRKELKQVDRVSMEALHRVRLILGRSKDPDNEVLANTVAPDKPGLRVERDRALDRLRDFSRNANQLIISDPYFFAGESNAAPAYVSDIVRATRLKSRSLKKLHVIFDSRCGDTKSYASRIKKVCSDNGMSFTRKDTSMVHDRFWIKDRKSALHVGTSIGGLGRRLSYIIAMPDEDLAATLKFLREQNLL